IDSGDDRTGRDDSLLGGAADARDWHPNGAGSTEHRCAGAGDEGRRGVGDDRGGSWAGGGFRRDPVAGWNYVLHRDFEHRICGGGCVVGWDDSSARRTGAHRVLLAGAEVAADRSGDFVAPRVSHRRGVAVMLQRVLLKVSDDATTSSYYAVFGGNH